MSLIKIEFFQSMKMWIHLLKSESINSQNGNPDSLDLFAAKHRNAWESKRIPRGGPEFRYPPFKSNAWDS